jgi:acyl-CoA thioesterase
MSIISPMAENDQFAKLVGIEIIQAHAGNAMARMKILPHHLNGLGLVHGGAIFTLADLAFAAASNSHGYPAVAVNVNISFLRAATQGILTATATEVSSNGKLGTYSIHVTDEANNIVAVFHGLSYRKSQATSPPPR